jgi:hypothetical protein
MISEYRILVGINFEKRKLERDEKITLIWISWKRVAVMGGI